MSSFSSIQVRIFVTINKKEGLMSFYFCYFLSFHVLMAILYIITTCVCVCLCVRRRFRVLIDAAEPARTVGFGPDSQIRKNGRPDKAGRGKGQGRVRLSVCLARQGRGQGAGPCGKGRGQIKSKR